MGLPFGEQTWQLKMAIEIVDFPIQNGDFPLLFVCSPDGILGNPCWSENDASDTRDRVRCLSLFDSRFEFLALWPDERVQD